MLTTGSPSLPSSGGKARATTIAQATVVVPRASRVKQVVWLRTLVIDHYEKAIVFIAVWAMRPDRPWQQLP